MHPPKVLWNKVSSLLFSKNSHFLRGYFPVCLCEPICSWRHSPWLCAILESLLYYKWGIFCASLKSTEEINSFQSEKHAKYLLLIIQAFSSSSNTGQHAMEERAKGFHYLPLGKGMATGGG